MCMPADDSLCLCAPGAAKVDTSALMEEDNEEEEGSDDVEGSDDAMDASDDDDVPSGQGEYCEQAWRARWCCQTVFQTALC